MNRSLALLAALALLLVACSPGTDAEPEPTDMASAAPPTASDSPTTGGEATDGPLGAPTASPAAQDPLLAMELVDVRTGEAFTLAELAADGPVLVETMAIWCTTCRAQMHEVIEAHERAEFASVGIDVDPNERAEELADYAEREGFDWPFVLADAELVSLLTERFGFTVTNPPSTPTFVVADGTIRALEFNRLRAANELIAELGAG